MYRILLPAALLLLHPLFLRAESQWVLEKAEISYHVSHPLHQIDGVSHGARAKGVCHDGQCEFLIAVPVKTFESGDSNRDVHMIQATRGGQFPMVVVRTRLPEAGLVSTTIHADIEIEFAGQTARYKQVAFQEEVKANEIRITGTIPATLSDFKIEPPSLLAMPIKNEIPVHVDLTWKNEK